LHGAALIAATKGAQSIDGVALARGDRNAEPAVGRHRDAIEDLVMRPEADDLAAGRELEAHPEVDAAERAWPDRQLVGRSHRFEVGHPGLALALDQRIDEVARRLGLAELPRGHRGLDVPALEAHHDLGG